MKEMTVKEAIEIVIEGLIQARKEFGCEKKDYVSITNAIDVLTNLKPLEEKEVENIIISKWSGMNDTSFASDLAREIVSHFSKPEIVYPEKKGQYYPDKSQPYGEELGKILGYNQAIDAMRKLNGGGACQ